MHVFLRLSLFTFKMPVTHDSHHERPLVPDGLWHSNPGKDHSHQDRNFSLQSKGDHSKQPLKLKARGAKSGFCKFEFRKPNKLQT